MARAKGFIGDVTLIWPLFIVLTLAGTWAGWRRSPLYSVAITLKLLGATALVAAVTVDASLAVTSSRLQNSPAALAVCGAILLPLLTTGAMVLITLDNTIALVTGASKGIGASVAKHLGAARVPLLSSTTPPAKPACFWRPTMAVPSPEWSCLWMADSHRCK